VGRTISMSPAAFSLVPRSALCSAESWVGGVGCGGIACPLLRPMSFFAYIRPFPHNTLFSFGTLFSLYCYFTFIYLIILIFSCGLYYMHCNYIRVGFLTWRICARLSYIRRCALAAPCWPPPSPIDLVFDKLTAFNRSSSSPMCRPLLI
jgi:hypothetical protein